MAKHSASELQLATGLPPPDVLTINEVGPGDSAIVVNDKVGYIVDDEPLAIDELDKVGSFDVTAEVGDGLDSLG